MQLVYLQPYAYEDDPRREFGTTPFQRIVFIDPAHPDIPAIASVRAYTNVGVARALGISSTRLTSRLGDVIHG